MKLLMEVLEGYGMLPVQKKISLGCKSKQHSFEHQLSRIIILTPSSWDKVGAPSIHRSLCRCPDLWIAIHTNKWSRLSSVDTYRLTCSKNILIVDKETHLQFAIWGWLWRFSFRRITASRSDRLFRFTMWIPSLWLPSYDGSLPNVCLQHWR